jgi:endonuclease/exonuclease/phosphatase family metal-dependent hydrolase
VAGASHDAVGGCVDEQLETVAAAEFPPVIVNRAAWPATDKLRVVAFNARWGLRLEQIIARLRRPPLMGAAVLLLTEIDCNVRRSHNRDVAAEIAEALAMSFAYVPEFAPRSQMPRPVSFLGNAILSGYPLSNVRAVALPNYRLPRRLRRLTGGPCGIAATINPNGTAGPDGREITIGVAHLHSRTAPAGRERQMECYLQALPSAGPAIIGGDFNTTTVALMRAREVIDALRLAALSPRRFRRPMRYEPLFARLAAAGFGIEGANAMGQATFTYSGAVPRWARPKLDWLALRGLEPVEGSAAVVAAKTGMLGRRFSDHDFVTCVVRV